MEEYNREPCPYRIVEDAGSAFTMGLIGGSIFHSFTGMKQAPRGHKISGLLENVRVRSPLTGVQFAAWGGMFSTIDCCMVAIRKKEDPLNSITSGALTGALLSVRSGPRIMAASGILGGVILAMIEGAGLVMSRWMTDVQYAQSQQPELEDPRNLASTSPSTSSKSEFLSI
uniref:Mitochondrial import inner membrane translocase subunit TIM17 n=1 Tax=Steinernema glaseri TaxID=37863 RepID=A0A1I8ARK2_9BILA